MSNIVYVIHFSRYQLLHFMFTIACTYNNNTRGTCVVEVKVVVVEVVVEVVFVIKVHVEVVVVVQMED